jgi:hypothetical protein
MPQTGWWQLVAAPVCWLLQLLVLQWQPWHLASGQQQQRQ